MNCKQFNTINLEEVLAALGHLPVRQNDKEAWYLNPFSDEKQASFKLDKRLNLWYLFSEGIGGTATDLVQKYLGASVNDVLQWASEQDFSSFPQQTNVLAAKPELNYYIDRIGNIQNVNLMRYLHERGISAKIYPIIKEIWFTMGSKKLYAIGFKNRLDGWEIEMLFIRERSIERTFLSCHILAA